eukprot:jgi/Botrbrau1/16469/Bobra.0142s0063.1
MYRIALTGFRSPDGVQHLELGRYLLQSNDHRTVSSDSRDEVLTLSEDPVPVGFALDRLGAWPGQFRPFGYRLSGSQSVVSFACYPPV